MTRRERPWAIYRRALASRPLRRRRVVAVIAAMLVVFAATWCLVRWSYNPAAHLAAPHVVKRARRGAAVTVLLGGDFAPADAAMPLIRRYGYRYPYRGTAAIVRAADVFFANLEAPVTASKRRALLWRKYSYRVAPAATAAWRWLGLDLVSLANNHIGDYANLGLRDTVRHLDAADIAHVGAGADESAARRPVIFDVGGTRVGFLAYLEHRAVYDLYLDLFAVGSRVGCAKLVRSDVLEDVRRLRPLVDVLVVSVHWGDNYAPVTAAQRRLGRWLVDIGVDVVAGHHAHDVQPIEVRRGRVIFYSLGNYAWGAPGRTHFRLGLLARLRITPRSGTRRGRLASVEIVPIAAQNRIVKYQPRPLKRDERRWLAPFVAATRALGTRLSHQGDHLRVYLR